MMSRSGGWSSTAMLLATIILLAASSANAAMPVPPMLDDAGRPKVITYSAKRIVTLAPALTELVYAANAGDKLVGVSAYSDYPDAAKRKPQVVDAAGISFEALLALKPDLVLAWKGGTRPADIARLESFGINVFVIDIRLPADIARALRTIGKLTGSPSPTDAPEKVAANFEEKLERLRLANKDKRPIRFFFEISQLPLMTINGPHFISETAKLCGGVNVFADAAQTVVEPSRETLLQRGADAILRPTSINRDVTRDIALYAGIAAHREGRVYALTPDWILRPGPRVLLAAEEICLALDQARKNMAAQKP